MRGLLLVLLLALTSAFDVAVSAQPADAPSAPAPQSSIWFEQRVGHVVVGITASGGRQSASLAYGYYLAAIGPRPATATKNYGNCVKQAVIDAGKSFIKALDDEAALFVPVTEPIYSDTQVNRTQNALVTARGEYKSAVIRYCLASGVTDPLRQFIDGTRLALVKRECSGRLCPGLEIPKTLEEPLQRGGDEREPTQISEGERRERVFEAIFWLLKQKGLDGGINQPILLDWSGTGGLAPRMVKVRPGVSWPEKLGTDRVQAAFESRVAQLDSDPSIPPLSSVVPAQIGLPRETVLRTAYAFREPQDAWDLGTAAAELALKNVQDEVARVRLRECKVFRGLRTVADVASCAGYEIDEPVLLECLNGGSCMPPAAATAQAGAILLGVRMRARNLASDAYIPRPFSDATGSFGALVDTYKACAADEATADDPGSCLALRSIPPELRRQADCLLQPGATNKMKCLVPDGPTAHAIDQLSRCVERGGRSCVLEAALPPDLACVASAQSVEDLQCLTPQLRGDAARLARCFSNGPDDVASRVLCVAGENVPQPVKWVVNCYSSTSSQAAVGTCLLQASLQASLPPEQVAVVRCAVESGGDVVAAGVCVAVPRLGLNPGQQILLQCLASSGGVPATTAACIVGRFTLIELQGCRVAEFGHSGCFGDGNEFQKLAVMLTGSKVSKNSVVGWLAIRHIEAANAFVLGAGHALSELSKGGKNTIEGFGHEIEKARKSPIKLLVNAPENIINEVLKGVKNVAENLNPANWRLH